ncbi:MAG: DNA polymerase III subunit delta [Coriobacteriia bacterium]|nr:DNA polymerase III subunit delta [Coriobacteriia bacterium]
MAQQNDLKPIYLILSEQAFLRTQATDRLKARLEKEGSLDFNFNQLDAGVNTPQEIIDAANTLPFASTYRLVFVTGIEQYKADDLALLVEYATDPNETTVLCLIGTKLAKSTRLYKQVVKVGAVLDRKAPAKKELPSVVAALFAEQGITAHSIEAVALINAVGEDLDVISGSIVKIRSYLGDKKEVSLADIAEVVATTAEVKIWEFSNALADKDAHQALARLTRTLQISGNSVFSAETFAIRTVRELITARALIDRGDASASVLAAETGKQEWLARKTLAQARKFTGPELNKALRGLGDVLEAARTGADELLLFERWVLRFTVGDFAHKNTRL